MNNLNHKNLINLSKDDLIQIILSLKANQPRIYKARPLKPTPRARSVRDMVQDYEENIIAPPSEFKDEPKPTPKARSVRDIVQDYEENIIAPPSEFKDEPKPITTPRTKIKEITQALRGYTKSFEIGIKNNKDPLLQLQNTSLAIKHHINKLLNEMKGLKFIETLKVTFTKMTNDDVIQKTAFFNSKAQTIINDLEIPESLKLSEQQILNFVAQWISEGSGWTIQLIDAHYLNIVKYEPMKGSSYIQLPTELRNSAKGLINLQNNDNKCFLWCHVRHLNSQIKNPQRIKRSDKQYVNKLNYDRIEFPVTNKQYNKIEKQNDININVFGYEEKQLFPIYISKEKFEDQMNLLLITKDNNKHYVLIEDFNKFMYKQTKHKEKKHFCMHCLQCFSIEKILTEHKDNCLVINGTQAVKMPEKGKNILKFENYHKQQAVPFVIYADFEAITDKISSCTPNDKNSYTEVYQKHTDCGYGYKVVCCYDDKYTKSVQIYRGEKAVYKFMEAMLEEVKYCKKVIRKHFKKPLKMTKYDEEEFQKAKACHICDKQYTDDAIRVRDHCHITGKYRGSAHQDCNLKLRIESDKNTSNIPQSPGV